MLHGAVALSVLTLLAALVWGRCRSVWLALTLALLFPPLAGTVMYWLPVMHQGGATSEYRAWFGLILGVWLLMAWPVSVVVTLLVRHTRQRRAAAARAAALSLKGDAE